MKKSLHAECSLVGVSDFRHMLVLFPAVVLIMTGRLDGASLPDELTGNFDADLEGWTSDQAGVALSHSGTGAWAEATGDGSGWHFVAPVAWSGDWSGYEEVRFVLTRLAGGKAADQSQPVVTISGSNGTDLVWNGYTPNTGGTLYSLPMAPATFGVDQATFDGVMADVDGLFILGEFDAGSVETIALDNVIVTATPLTVHVADLVEDWTGEPVDFGDWTLSAGDGFLRYATSPAGVLVADDYASGEGHSFVTPESWRGNWGAFRRIRFDLSLMEQGGPSLGKPVNLILRGVAGVARWRATHGLAYPVLGQWGSYSVPLDYRAFVDDASDDPIESDAFDAILGHVTSMEIDGEFVDGNEDVGLDNVVITTDPGTPVILEDLVSSFDVDAEDWRVEADGALVWQASGGYSGGYLQGRDQASGGSWRFLVPETWLGDWRNLEYLEYRMKIVNGQTVPGASSPAVWIRGANGVEMAATSLYPHTSWTLFRMPLEAATFGVDEATFDSVIQNVVSMTILGEWSSGVDWEGLDEVGLYTDRPPTVFPERLSAFETDGEGWRVRDNGGITWQATGGNPDGYLEGVDHGGGSYVFVTPEAWSGDWSAYQSVRYDLKLLQPGPYESGWELGIRGANHTVIYWDGPLPSTEWTTYEIPLTAGSFGVDQSTFDGVMENVVELFILGDLVANNDREGLDNVVLSTSAAASPYDVWKATAFTPGEAADPLVSGPDADPDGDGGSNLYEFGTGTGPKDATSARWPAVDGIVGDRMRLSYVRRSGGAGTTGVDYVADGVRYVPEVSTDLVPGGWQSGAGIMAVVGSAVDNGDGTETVVVECSLPVGGLPVMFGRLRLEMVP